MVTVNLLALNEDKKEKVKEKNSTSTNTNYNSLTGYNPINAISVYIKSLEFIINKINTTYPKIKNGKNIIGEDSLKIQKIFEEFKKGFLLPKEHEAYKHFNYFYERFDFMEERLALFLITEKKEYLNDIEKMASKLIETFSGIAKTMQEQEVVNAEQRDKGQGNANENNLEAAVKLIPESELSSSFKLEYSV